MTEGTFPFLLKTHSIEEWLKEFCDDGDLLKVINTVGTDGKGECKLQALQNQRTKQIYIFFEERK